MDETKLPGTRSVGLAEPHKVDTCNIRWSHLPVVAKF
jgi:hypothetical protein